MARTMTAVTASIPSSLRGRVSSTVFIGIGLGFPLGSLAAGFVAKYITVARTFMVCGALIITAAVLLGLIKKYGGIRYAGPLSENQPLGSEAVVTP
jgi:MFS family permease